MPRQDVQNASRRRRPQRMKHVPQRMCISCRESSAKRSLTRIVRTPDNSVEVDLTGKKNGRGAYICEQRSCWEKAITTPILGRSLNTTISPQATEALREYVATLPADSEQDERATDSREPTV